MGGRSSRLKQKLGTVFMRCCITPAIPNTLQRTGTRFFQHKGKRPENCLWQPVSEEHQALQATAAQAIQAREGWKVGIEEAEGGWRADALAERGRLRIAFEILIVTAERVGHDRSQHPFLEL